jgi:hypothetical protein
MNLGREEKRTSKGWVALQPAGNVFGSELSFARCRFRFQIAPRHQARQSTANISVFVALVQFYNTTRCWPTRGALLTGYYAQQIHRDALPDVPGGARGVRQPWARVPPDFLKPAGYRCYHSGKWHIDGKVLDGGFDRSLNMRNQGNYFSAAGNTMDDKPLKPATNESGYYATIATADHAIEKEHETYLRGFLWTLANHPRAPEAIRKKTTAYALAQDGFTDNGGRRCAGQGSQRSGSLLSGSAREARGCQTTIVKWFLHAGLAARVSKALRRPVKPSLHLEVCGLEGEVVISRDVPFSELHPK